MKIDIYYHITAYSGWQSLVENKVQLMINVGLWQRADRIRFQIHYPGADGQWLMDQYGNDSRVQFWSCTDSRPPIGEIYSVIDLREQVTQSSEPRAVFRYHTKGISHIGKPTQPISDSWTNYIDYWNIEQWKLCYSLLKNTEYETVGCNWHSEHYSGNVWWAKSDYLKRTKVLSKPHEINFQSQLRGFSLRHDSELWIGTGQPKYVTLHQFQHAVVYHVEPPNPEDYRLDKLGC